MDGPVLLLERIDRTLATTRFFFLGGGGPIPVASSFGLASLRSGREFPERRR